MDLQKMLVLAVAMCAVAGVAADITISGDKIELNVDHNVHKSHGKSSGKAENPEKSNSGQYGVPALSGEVQHYIEQLATNATNYLQHLLDTGSFKQMIKDRLAGQALAQTVPAKSSQRDAVTCPPPGFNSVSPFSFKDYINASWYIQKQKLIGFSPPSDLYCIKATYIPLDYNDLSKGITIYNYGTRGLNGEVQGTSGIGGSPSFFQFQGIAPNPKDASKLRVGPSFDGPIANLTLGLLGLPTTFYVGDYWVVAAGPKQYGEPGFDGYKWAIVSGGPPLTPSNGACTPGIGLPWQLSFAQDGYWLITRDPVASPELIAEIEAVGARLGFDNSVLQNVTQAGCTYAGSKNVTRPTA